MRDAAHWSVMVDQIDSYIVAQARDGVNQAAASVGRD